MIKVILRIGLCRNGCIGLCKNGCRILKGIIYV